jgi:hypothetical protein
VSGYNPYFIGVKPGPGLRDQIILGELAAGDASRKLTDMAQCFGAERVSDLADFRKHATALGVGSIGTSTSVYMDLTNRFAKALESYQKALLSYRDATRAGSLLQFAKKLDVRKAFDRLQTQFQSELKILTARTKSSRGTPLTRPERGINIARSSRSAYKLHVANQAHAHGLVRFTRHAKILGNGLAVVDFGSRAGTVHNAYAAGENWHREMFVQSASFTAGGIASVVGVKGGLALLAVFTPAGLVGLIIGGLAIAGTTAAGAYFTDRQVQECAGGWYDTIIEWMASLQ